MNTKQTTTLPRMAALKAEAVAEANHQPVVDALCTACGQPTAQWVVAQNATLTTENERLTKELMRPDYNGDEDRFWGFAILLLAIVVSFALGWVMSSAVGV